MGLSITKSDIDNYRNCLKNAEPYSEEELFSGSEKSDGKRMQATCAKNILLHFGLSLTNENDYGNFED